MSNTAQGASAPIHKLHDDEKGLPSIQTLSLSRCRAAAHRAMALAALRADSSLRHRLARYNHHMSKARHLEGMGVRHD